MKNYARLFICSFIAALFAIPAEAQLKKGLKLLKKNNYEAAIEALEVDVFNSKGNIAVEAEYYIAKIYFTKEYEGYSLENAYQYAKSAMKRHQNLTNDEMASVQKKGLGKLNIDNYKRKILNEAFQQAKATDSYASYEHFLNNFDGPTAVQGEKIMKLRNQRGLEEAAKLNTWNAFENFYKKHQENCRLLSPEVDTVAQLLMFEAYVNETNWNGYNRFAADYPDNIYVKETKAAEAFLEIAQSSKIDDYKKFVVAFPQSRFVKLAINSIYRLTMQSNDVALYDYFVRNHADHPKIKDFWRYYYSLFLKEFGTKADFRKMYPNAPVEK